MEVIDNDLNVNFCIWEYEDITHEEITKELSLIPHKVYIKGEKVHPKVERLAKQNGWIYGAPYFNKDDFETQMNKILDALEPKIPILREYAKRYYCEFSCAIFLNNRDESTPWIHFDKRYNAFIREVDAEFDFDIYYPPLDEE
ncbi:DUF4279 domain-containing protein [Chryseobacterium koreense]